MKVWQLAALCILAGVAWVWLTSASAGPVPVPSPRPIVLPSVNP